MSYFSLSFSTNETVPEWIEVDLMNGPGMASGGKTGEIKEEYPCTQKTCTQKTAMQV